MSNKFDPNEIQWFDGMVLSCHHFQQEQIRSKHFYRYIFEKMNPYSWGVVSIDFDYSQGNIFKLNSLECILSDYSILFFPNYEDETMKTLTLNGNTKYVYCVLSDEYDFEKRYDSMYSNEVYDLNTGTNKQKIVRLIPKFTLTTEDPPKNSLYLPLLKLEQGMIPKFVSYDPPCPNFDQTIYAKKLVKDIVSKLEAKLNDAYNKIKITDDLSHFHKYGWIILRDLLPLQSILNSKLPSTFEVYQHMLRLCASVASLDPYNPPSNNWTYNHYEIYDSFLELCKFIDSILDSINKINFIGFKKFEYDNARFSSIIDLKDSNELKIICQFEKNADFQSWIQNAIITSHNSLEEAKLSRTIGCNREIVDSKIVDNTLCVTVKITYQKEYIKSNLLCILNVVNPSSQPQNLYILE